MKFKKKLKSLKFFLLKSKATRLYRDYVKEIFRVKNLDLRNEYIEELRRDFIKYRDLENEDQIDFLLAEGRQKLPMIKEMISRTL